MGGAGEPILPPGLTVRAVEPDRDAQAVTDFCRAAAIAEVGVSDVTLQAVRESYNAPRFNPATDARLVFDPDGALVAVVEFYDNDTEHVAPYVFLRVRPDRLGDGIEDALLVWAEGRGRQALGLAAPHLRVALHAVVAGVNERMQRALERCGWRQERIFWEMEIVLDAEPSRPALPQGIVIRTARVGEERAVHDAEAEAFVDHFGYVLEPWETWEMRYLKLNPYDPSLWFLAMDEEQIAGISLCMAEQRGRPDSGYVHTLGVRPAWRGQGLGLALLQASFAGLYARGRRRIALDVDSESRTGATRLYERAGMRAIRDTRAYERVLRHGTELRTV